MISKCSSTSLDRFFLPASWLPSMSTRQISFGFKKPLQCIVGVQRTSFSFSRTLMLPSFAAANPRL